MAPFVGHAVLQDASITYALAALQVDQILFERVFAHGTLSLLSLPRGL